MVDKEKRIHFLDYMRIFAFVSVLLGHKFFGDIAAATVDPTLHATLRAMAAWLLPLCIGGAAGVVVFFLTSGYIITHVLQLERPGEFLLKRVFRIYPLYMVAVVAEVLAAAWSTGTPVPPLSVMLPRLLLIGDFFDTPIGLGNVEWTLRVEILFYLLMAGLARSGLLQQPFRRHLPLIYLGIGAVLTLIPLFPAGEGFTRGYVNIYGPFLLIGSLVYLIEKDPPSRAFAWLAISAMMLSFFVLMPTIHPYWMESHYAILALVIFVVGWLQRDRFVTGTVAGLLSSLTYAVYLFHNWLWDHLKTLLTTQTWVPGPIVLTTLLLLICYGLHRVIEIPGIRLGRRLTSRFTGSNRRLQPQAHAVAGDVPAQPG